MAPSMKVTYFYSNASWWARAHRTGCKDILTENRREGLHKHPFEGEYPSRDAVTEEATDDFWGESGDSIEDFRGWVSFAPCLDDLPLEGEG